MHTYTYIHTAARLVNGHMREFCSSTEGGIRSHSKKLRRDEKKERYKCDKNEPFMNTENAEYSDRLCTCMHVAWRAAFAICAAARATLYSCYCCCSYHRFFSLFFSSLVCNSYLAFVCVCCWASSMPIYLYAT